MEKGEQPKSSSRSWIHHRMRSRGASSAAASFPGAQRVWTFLLLETEDENATLVQSTWLKIQLTQKTRTRCWATEQKGTFEKGLKLAGWILSIWSTCSMCLAQHTKKNVQLLRTEQKESSTPPCNWSLTFCVKGIIEASGTFTSY